MAGVDGEFEMSKEPENILPRVQIIETDDKASIGMNFSTSSVKKPDDLGEKLEELADEWTAFCISFLNVVPEITSIGFSIAHGIMKKSLVKYLDENSVSHEVDEKTEGEKKTSYIIHDEDITIVLKILGKSRSFLTAADALKRSTLSSLLAEYEYFISKVLLILGEEFPNTFIDNNKQFHFSELNSIDSIDDFKRKLVEKKISELLQTKSHSDVLDWIKKNFGISGLPNDELRKEFFEICERRHLLIHNGGVVNKKYRDNCVKAGIAKSDIPEVGVKLDVSSHYLRRATARVYQVGFFILHMLWQKLFAQQIQISYLNLLSTSHSFLENDLTKMSSRVIEFAQFSDKKVDHLLKMFFVINKAQCSLFDPKLSLEQQNGAALQILNDFDWSVTTPTVDLALTCLKRDFREIIPLAKAAADDGVSYEDARTFNVFREAREQEGFLDCFPKAVLAIEHKQA
jgi:hypothetical protein